MSPIFSTIRIELEEPKSTNLAHILLEKDLSSDVAPSPSPLIDALLSTPTKTASSVNDLASPTPTQPLDINEKDAGYEYVTMSVTLPYTTYTTTILLGDSFPTSATNDLVPTTYAVPTTSSNTKVQNPGISTGTIVGIVVGLIVGFLALFGVFYVYLLRARQEKRRRRRRRSRRGSTATTDGGAPPPPPPGGAPGPGPGPFPPAG